MPLDSRQKESRYNNNGVLFDRVLGGDLRLIGGFMYAVQLVNCGTGERREWRITGEMYDYIAQIVTEASGLRGCFPVEPGEH
jgi:hypothetical protein